MTMNIGNLHKAASLARDIERLAETVAAYRYAESINVTTPHKERGAESHRVELTAAEIGDAVFEALSRRLDAMRVELYALGVTPPAWHRPAPAREPGAL
jgi:hypothetical protein